MQTKTCSASPLCCHAAGGRGVFTGQPDSQRGLHQHPHHCRLRHGGAGGPGPGSVLLPLLFSSPASSVPVLPRQELERLSCHGSILGASSRAAPFHLQCVRPISGVRAVCCQAGQANNGGAAPLPCCWPGVWFLSAVHVWWVKKRVVLCAFYVSRCAAAWLASLCHLCTWCLLGWLLALIIHTLRMWHGGKRLGGGVCCELAPHAVAKAAKQCGLSVSSLRKSIWVLTQESLPWPSGMGASWWARERTALRRCSRYGGGDAGSCI